MPYAPVRSLNDTLAQRDRRLVTGLAVSVLLHGLLLSLQFGIPGFDAGPGGPLQVRLAPLPTPAPDPLPASVLAPELPLPPLVTPAPAPATTTGIHLVDPRPQPLVVAEAVAPKARPAARPAPRRLPKRRAPVAPPIIASNQADAAFAVAPPLPEMEADTLPGVASVEVEDAPDAVVAASGDEQAREAERLRQQEAERIAAAEAQQREAERQLREEQERLAAQRAEQQRTFEQQQADQQLAERQQAEQRAQEQRRAEQLAAEQARIAQQQIEERRRAEAEQQRLAQLREREEALARAAQEVQLRQQAAERLAAEEAERRRLQAQLEAQARQRAEELAQRQAAEEGARRLAEERAQAERLARERLEEAGRRAAAERLQAQALPGNGSAGPGGPGNGNGAGDGARPPGAVPGSATATRARELLRGLTIPNVDPPPARPVNPFAGSRRVVSDGAEGDVPLRLYVDSVRQKLERNAVLGGSRFKLQDVRIDPLVSLTLRSDGSIDDVTIVRSSGRADMDDAVRRFVQLNARYSAFPPNVAARFDVIEIRRVWRFVDGLKLLEEMR